MLPEQVHQTVPSASAEPYFYDLKALKEEEFAAFAGGPNSSIAHAALRELHMDHENALNEKTICAADDLFECGKSLADTHPAMVGKGKLARAVFDIRIESSDRPHKLCICPPNRITFESPGDAPRVFPWLEKCRLRLLRQFTSALCLLLLAVAGAVASSGDWDDTDDDEGEAERCVHAA